MGWNCSDIKMLIKHHIFMTKILRTLFLLLLASTVSAEDVPLSPVCWPLNLAGITLGVTTDSEVKRLLGTGIFRKDEGDTGGRYFVDLKRTATLHTLSFTDDVIGELTIEEGVLVGAHEEKAAKSKWFNPKQGFGNWHALHLGSTKAEVRANLGSPVVDGSNANSWRFDSKCACELEIFFTLYFKNDRVYKVVFSAPPG